MTTLETKEILESCKEHFKNKKISEAMDEAIEALKHREVELNGCLACKHLNKLHEDEPCTKCKNAYTNKFEWNNKYRREENGQES